MFNGNNGAVIREFFAFEANYAGGVYVAAGDATGLGRFTPPAWAVMFLAILPSSMFHSLMVPSSLHEARRVPAGFTAAGLPVGIQIVGRHKDDLGLLKIAHAFEQAILPHLPTLFAYGQARVSAETRGVRSCSTKRC